MSLATRKKFHEGTWAAILNQLVLLVGFARVFPLTAGQEVYLPSSGRKGSSILTANSEKYNFRDIPEVESNPATVGAAIFSDLVPNEIALVFKSPSFHYRDSVGQ